MRHTVNILEGRKLGKSFSGVKVLNNVDIRVESGKVHALVGANGAGKSTLVKILTGYYEDYEGEIFINGKRVELRTPSDAIANGIAVVHQEVDSELVPDMTVAENLYLEDFAQKTKVVIKLSDLARRASRDLRALGFDIPVEEKISNLPLHEKQRIVIAKALLRKARFLILDEPTAALSYLEIERLFELIEDLKSKNVAVLYITQKLDEMKKIADEVTVLRNGEKVGYFTEIPDLSKIVELMLASPQEDLYPPKSRKEVEKGKPILSVRGISLGSKVRNVSFNVKKGEVVAITGLTGAGKTEILKIIFGALKPDEGEVYLDGERVRFNSPAEAIENGVYLVPEERQKEGLIMTDPARKNISLPFLRMFSGVLGKVDRKRELKHARFIADMVKLVPPDVEKEVRFFSGGNQQKIVVGRWMGGNPKVLLMDEPTRGMDIGAKREIYKLVRKIAENSAVLVATNEVEEALGIGDRVIVMKDGEKVFEKRTEETSISEVMEYVTGVKK